MNAGALREVSGRMGYYLDQIPKESNLEVLRGIEGDAAHGVF